jgi:hypothetical protein
VAQLETLAVVGVATIDPSPQALSPRRGGKIFPLDLSATYGASKEAEPTISALVGAPYAVPFEGILRVRWLAIRVSSGSLVVLVSTSSGAAQAVRVSDLWVLHNPNDGDHLTAVSFAVDPGTTADVRYQIAGDVS